jgi:hypothetical protein
MSVRRPTQPSLLLFLLSAALSTCLQHARMRRKRRGRGARPEALPFWKRMPGLSCAPPATLPPEHTPLPRLRAPEDGGDRSAREQVAEANEGQKTTRQRLQRRPPMPEPHVLYFSMAAQAFSSVGIQLATTAPLAPPRRRQSYDPKISPQLTRPQIQHL